jgi:4-alpha-glucanotransferase
VLAELGADGPRAEPSALVVRQGERPELTGELTTEDGAVLTVPGRLPADLPLGWHRLVTAERELTLVVSPPRLAPMPPAWGWQVQLYALHSAGSAGIGDLADLRAFVTGAGAQGAGVVLVNPVQAITPASPVQRSPYSPSSRRFANPLYLRVGTPAPAGELIDYDAVWTAKLAALQGNWAGQVRVDELAPDLRDFATFCALAERHGADWRKWPPGLRHPNSPEVAEARAELADRVAFHGWLQRLCAEQLAGVHAAARAAGVRVVHDLPVGADPAGADAWALQDVLASDVTVGAPPDAFSQQGQDWNLPPWRPDRLAAAGYRPFRDLIRGVLAHADGIRIDHVAGLWRLWWIPPGFPPSQGTYVHYDSAALLGILALEAHRAAAIVVGEDLGTVRPEVTETLHERGMQSSAVLWFQRDQDVADTPLLAPSRWPAEAMASISTHDLPTAAGFLRAEHVRVRAELDLLADPDEEYRRAAEERAELIEVLDAHGLLPAEATEEELVAALHALLATASSRLLLISPQDALGDPRQPNLPGTIDEYPNWRIPLPVPVDELLSHPAVRRAIAPLCRARPRTLRS